MNSKTLLKRYLVSVVIGIIGILSIILLISTHRIHEALHTYYLIDDMNHEVQTLMLESHLLLEDIVHTDAREKMKEVMTNIDLSFETLDVMLVGGETFHDKVVSPLRDLHLREEAESIRASIIELKKATEEKMAADDMAEADAYYDTLFNVIIEKANAMKSSIEIVLSDHEAALSRSYTRFLYLWSLTLSIVLIIIVVFEQRRNKSAEALKEQQRHLESIVTERTSELSLTNKDLKEEITKKEEAEKTLIKSRETYKILSSQLSNILEAIDDPIVQISPEFKVLWTNTAASARYGKSISELKGEHGALICAIKPEPCEKCPTRRSFESGKVESDNIAASDGNHWDVRSFPIKGEDGSITSVIEIRSDVTEKIRRQEEAIRADQLTSLGELAAGVAHEINNPINGIINLAQLITDNEESGKSGNRHAEKIIYEGHRISDIVKSLLSFARDGKNVKTGCTVSNIIDETLSLMTAQLRKDHIKLSIRVEDALPSVKVNFQQIEQVFLNIINNARYSLNKKYPLASDNKVLEIIAEEVEVEDKPYVQVVFHDQGTGIAADIVNKITNPFFTTKPRGSGTGLGLSISESILKDHGGFLRIDTSEGNYTKVITGLPTMDNSHMTAGKESPAKAGFISGHPGE
jgi:C4-dicarboxylate-specific signal transduction histidine kinase